MPSRRQNSPTIVPAASKRPSTSRHPCSPNRRRLPADSICIAPHALNMSQFWTTPSREETTPQAYRLRYNEQHEASENYASHKSDAAFLTRIAVNFIRHELTEYDHALADVAGKTGITKAVDGIRQKVYSAIAAAYPVFSLECQRQCVARQERHA